MKTLIALTAAAALAGCAQPGVELNAPSSQYKITNAAHWESLAARTADSLTTRLRGVPETTGGGHTLVPGRVETASLGSRTYYINSQQPDSAFSKVFTPYLREALMRKGYAVSTRQANSVVVNYSAQTFYYGGPGGAKRPIDYASFWTTLGAVALAFTYADFGVKTAGIAGGLGLMALGPLIDVLAQTGDVTKAEVVLTTSVVSGPEVAHQHSETLYVKPADMTFYWSEYPELRPMETPGIGSDALALTRIRVQN